MNKKELKKGKELKKCDCKSLENGSVVVLDEKGNCVVCGRSWAEDKKYNKVNRIDVSDGEESFEIVERGGLLAEIEISKEGIYIRKIRGEFIKF